MIAAHRFEIAPPPLAIDLAGQDLTSGSATWTALPALGETTVSAADSRRELDYMHARFFSPTTARFLSTDPILGSPRTPQSWNRYAYVQGNPLKFVDPDGQDVVYADDYSRDAVASTREVSPGTDAVLRNFERDSTRTLTFEVADIQDTSRGLRLGQTATDRQGISPEERPRNFIVQLDRAAIELKGADSRTVVIHETVGHVLPNSQTALKALRSDPKSVAKREREAQRLTAKELRRIDKNRRPKRLEEVEP